MKLFDNLLNKKLKYLIIGAGSVGATFSCFLHSASKNVTLISKYDSVINTVRKQGLHLTSTVKGEHTYKIKITDEKSYKDKADVIVLCIRTPDILSALTLIEKASHKNTIVFSISNGYGIGYALNKKLKNKLCVIDANFVGKCRWFNRENAEYLQLREYVELNLSDSFNCADNKLLYQIKDDFSESGMNTAIMNSDEFNKNSFERLITRSPFEACCIYFDINANQIVDEKRIMFENLCNELLILAKALNIDINKNFLNEYYANFEKYKERDDANVYSSILHDMKIGQNSEIDFLFFIVLELAKEYGVNLPCYSMIAEKFKQYKTIDKYFN